MTECVQQLSIHLTGGQTLSVVFGAETSDVMNSQIEAFLKKFSDRDTSGSFVFQGARIIVVRLGDVSAAEVVSLVKKPKEVEEQQAK